MQKQEAISIKRSSPGDTTNHRAQSIKKRAVSSNDKSSITSSTSTDSFQKSHPYRGALRAMPLPSPFRRRSALSVAIRRNDARKIANILATSSQIPSSRHITSAISSASYSALATLLSTVQPNNHCTTTLVARPYAQHALTPALHAAAAALDPVSLSILLSSEAPARASQRGLEPIHAAIRTKPNTRHQFRALTQVLEVLVSAGATDGHFEDDFYPPNYAIAQRNHHALATLLSTESPHISKSLHRHSTIRYVCTHVSPHMLSIVLPHIDVTQTDPHGSTPLHHAVSSPHAAESTILEMAEIIIRAGCPVSEQDVYGRTPFQIARRRHMERVMHCLADFGASEDTFAQLLLKHARRESRNHAARIMQAGIPVKPISGKCSICLDALASKSAVQMSCGHTHHKDCLSRWVRSKASCPLCKQRLP